MPERNGLHATAEDKSKSLRRFIRREIFISGTAGVCFSVLVFVLTHKEAMWERILAGIAEGWLVALGVALVIGLIELIERVLKYGTEFKLLVQDTKNDVVTMIGVDEAIQKIKAQDVLNDIMTVMGAAGKILEHEDKLYCNVLRKEIADLRRRLIDMADHGMLAVPSEGIMEVVSREMESASQVFATCFVEQGNRFWESDAGKEYLRKNLEFLDRGVLGVRTKITRVFIMTENVVRSADVDAIKRQTAGGVDVKIARFDNGFSHLFQSSKFSDFALFDTGRASTWSPRRPLTRAEWYHERTDEYRQIIQLRDEIKAMQPEKCITIRPTDVLEDVLRAIGVTVV